MAPSAKARDNFGTQVMQKL